VILAALHDLALAGRAPALAAAYAAADGDAAAGAAIDTLLAMTDSVVAIAVRRRPRSNETGRCPVLDPAIAEAARRVGANAVGLIDVGCSAGLNLNLERRLRFLHRLDQAAAGRAVAWVSAEGVGVAPAIPTLGDRRASGHSIVGVAVLDRSALRAEAIGRCWSQGRLLAWLTGH
jgi:hypothetical protein